MKELQRVARYIVTDKEGYIKGMGRVEASKGKGRCQSNYSFKPSYNICNGESVSFYPDLVMLFLEKEGL